MYVNIKSCNGDFLFFCYHVTYKNLHSRGRGEIVVELVGDEGKLHNLPFGGAKFY